jgi:hypothetical protein
MPGNPRALITGAEQRFPVRGGVYATNAPDREQRRLGDIPTPLCIDDTRGRWQNISRTQAVMQPLYLARIEDLRRGDLAKVDCAACHHVALLTPDFLLRLGLSPAAKVLWCIDSRRFVEFTTYAPASRLEYQAPAELATLAGHNTFVGPRFFDVGRSA